MSLVNIHSKGTASGQASAVVSQNGHVLQSSHLQESIIIVN